VGEMFADDVAAGGAEDIADEEDIHWKSLHGGRPRIRAENADKNRTKRGRCRIRLWVW
jgi:hypothetical protein